MKLDLAAVAGQLTAAKGGVRAIWAGGKVEIDEDGFVGRVASVVATAMGQNLYRGQQTDGSGPMPGRKKDGKPRGQGSAIARALAAVPAGKGAWLITAHKEIPGHLARIFQEIEFKPPPLDTLTTAIRMAFERSTTTAAFAMALATPTSPFAKILRGGTKRKLGTLARQAQPRGTGKAFTALAKGQFSIGLGTFRLASTLRGGRGYGRVVSPLERALRRRR